MKKKLSSIFIEAERGSFTTYLRAIKISQIPDNNIKARHVSLSPKLSNEALITI